MTILTPWQFLLLALAGILNWKQEQVIEYLKEEIRVLRELLGQKRLQLNDQQRGRLAVKAKALGRQVLEGLGCIVTPDTLLRWYRDTGLYLIRPSRGADVVAEALGSNYTGALTHDGWCAYDPFSEASHGQCQNHLLRRCANLLDAARRGAARLPHAIKALLQDGLALRDRRDAGDISQHGLAVATGRLEARLERIVHGTYTFEPNARFVRHLARHQGQVVLARSSSGI